MWSISIVVLKWYFWTQEKTWDLKEQIHQLRGYILQFTFILMIYLSFFFNIPFTGHVNNLHETCLWMLVKGETEREAQEFLKVLILSLFMYVYVYAFYMHILIVLIPKKNAYTYCK